MTPRVPAMDPCNSQDQYPTQYWPNQTTSGNQGQNYPSDFLSDAQDFNTMFGHTPLAFLPQVQAQQNPASYGTESPPYNRTGSNPQGWEGLMDGGVHSFHFNFLDLYLCLS